MLTNEKRKEQGRIIRSMDLLLESKSAETFGVQTSIYDLFKKVIRIGTSDEVAFIETIEDIGASFVEPEMRIKAFAFAAVKASDGSAFQKHMTEKWNAEIDALPDLNDKIRFIADAADKAVNDTQFCFASAGKWVEEVKKIEKHGDIIHICNNTLNETKSDGFAEDGFTSNRYFTFKVREVKRAHVKLLNKENAASATRRESHEVNEYARSLGYRVY